MSMTVRKAVVHRTQWIGVMSDIRDVVVVDEPVDNRRRDSPSPVLTGRLPFIGI
jgi:hypothetical protein